jgi:hypothetical protein
MGDLRTLKRISRDIKRWNIRLNDEELLNHTIGRRTETEIERIENSESSIPRIKWIVEVLEVVSEMGLKPQIWRAQNIFYLITKGYRKGLWVFTNDEWKNAHEQLGAFMKGQTEIKSLSDVQICSSRTSLAVAGCSGHHAGSLPLLEVARTHAA